MLLVSEWALGAKASLQTYQLQYSLHDLSDICEVPYKVGWRVP